MKRRNFIGGILSAIGLSAVTLKATEITQTKSPIKTDEDEFYSFFYKFNGFPISKEQKMFYDWYNKDYKKMTMGRQTGTTTFLITLAAYKSLENETVVYFTFDEQHRKYIVDTYKKKMINYRENFPRKVWTHLEPIFLINRDGLGTINPSIALFDNWSYYTTYPITIFNYLNSKNIKVFWLDTVETKLANFV